jgi:hypothetical protein
MNEGGNLAEYFGRVECNTIAVILFSTCKFFIIIVISHRLVVRNYCDAVKPFSSPVVKAERNESHVNI